MTDSLIYLTASGMVWAVESSGQWNHLVSGIIWAVESSGQCMEPPGDPYFRQGLP
ncbi:MAG: hypothetical protein GY924_05725 [Planctomycetaceae bacterium]|nr:hypothetical protein [Planctomycetaceae bacterium]